MNGMVCRECGARFYSAAAVAMVDRGDTCNACGGALELCDVNEVDGGDRVRVGADGGDEQGTAEPRRLRRFGRWGSQEPG